MRGLIRQFGYMLLAWFLVYGALIRPRADYQYGVLDAMMLLAAIYVVVLAAQPSERE